MTFYTTLISTDNCSEIYHSNLNKRVNEKHPEKSSLICHLMKIEKKSIWQLKQLALGYSVCKNIGNKWKERIVTLMKSFYSEVILVDEFFDGMEDISKERNCIKLFNEDVEQYDDGSSINTLKLRNGIKIVRKCFKVDVICDERKNSKFVAQLNEKRKKKLAKKKKMESEIVQNANEIIQSAKQESKPIKTPKKKSVRVNKVSQKK